MQNVRVLAGRHRMSRPADLPLPPGPSRRKKRDRPKTTGKQSQQNASNSTLSRTPSTLSRRSAYDHLHRSSFADLCQFLRDFLAYPRPSRKSSRRVRRKRSTANGQAPLSQQDTTATASVVVVSSVPSRKDLVDDQCTVARKPSTESRSRGGKSLSIRAPSISLRRKRPTTTSIDNGRNGSSVDLSLSTSSLPEQAQTATLEEQLRDLALNQRDSFSSATTSAPSTTAGSMLLSGLTLYDEQVHEDETNTVVSLPLSPPPKPLPRSVTRMQSSPSMSALAQMPPRPRDNDALPSAGSRMFSLDRESIDTMVPRRSTASCSMPVRHATPKKNVVETMRNIRRSISSFSLFRARNQQGQSLKGNSMDWETLDATPPKLRTGEPRTSMVINDISRDTAVVPGSSYAQCLASLADEDASDSDISVLVIDDRESDDDDSSSVIIHQPSEGLIRKSISEPRMRGPCCSHQKPTKDSSWSYVQESTDMSFDRKGHTYYCGACDGAHSKDKDVLPRPPPWRVLWKRLNRVNE
ncbi:hypothetical protein, variant [Spizellomyces punctatus DAOM BR117]|uniref:Uncharacterized protein n=1 Tax=Spizellomyces punctatus (strain DAOM BR117) TaxID=645134 RepID=A0A0L0HU22_SPIPD|nr:hypothetical protein, variant [Spizellomyces punctatus DAOM BR117]KND04415.1 hypothetical protein, variant [Spizellomyces punctatus DAOM BR117]|eukprot:XP_016612454.1 hypothetical protein, variant [Spizellomyces punctatus DAOM BR117]